jgi:prephenate dehydrogenase
MSSPLKFKQLGLIGCGLMGASFALALQKHGLVDKVVGFSPSQRTRERAVQLGVVQQAAGSAAEAVQGSDIVLLAVPVSRTAECLQAIASALSPDCLLMDVGSTKTDVVQAAIAHLGERLKCFVPAHPIAGKAQAGVDHAEASLYEDRRAILTPMAQTGARQLEQAQQVWKAIGSQVSLMNPKDHDATFAAVSHVPHLLAFAAVNALSAQDQGAAFLKMAGPGFRDFSRIAASDPDVWRDILSANQAEVLKQTSLFRAALEQFENAIQNNDLNHLQKLIEEASRVRSSWSLQTGLTGQTEDDD